MSDGFKPFVINGILVLAFAVFLAIFAVNYFLANNSTSIAIANSNIPNYINSTSKTLVELNESISPTFDLLRNDTASPTFLFLMVKQALNIPQVLMAGAKLTFISINDMILPSLGIVGNSFTIIFIILALIFFVIAVILTIEFIRTGISER